MQQSRSHFLTARWTNLCLLTYSVDPALVRPHLPPGLVLDELPEHPGRGLVSLVAFDFLDTRVRGIRIPGHVNFPEVNLRFYVRDPKSRDRGVCFIRELVPRHAIAYVARWVYNEPYRVARMRSSVTTVGERIRVEHRFRFSGADSTIVFDASRQAQVSAEASPERLLTQQTWGYGTTRSGRRLRYRVDHPIWELHADTRANVQLDFAAVYGRQWGFLHQSSPVSTILAAGSEVSVAPADVD